VNDVGKKTDDLLDEVLKNYRDDRKELVILRAKLMNSLKTLGDDLELGGIAGISENVVKLSDVLTRMNAQAIELTKVNMKHELISDSNSLDSPHDKENIFDEIESKKSEEDLN
jgi:hypothetical protein